MPKDPDELVFRIISSEEVSRLSSGKKVKPIMVEKIAEKFINPETQEPIQVGEAVEAGPFDSEEEGRNWMKYYLPDVYKHEKLQFGKEKNKSGKTKSPFSVDPKPRDGKWYFWIIRVTE